MSRAEPRFAFRNNTRFGETEKQKERRKFLFILDEWGTSWPREYDIVLDYIDLQTDKYHIANPGWLLVRCREEATDDAAEELIEAMKLRLLLPASRGQEEVTG